MPVRIALISICKTCADAPDQPCGLLPLADGTLAQYQMKLAIDAGATKIIMFVQAVAGQIILLENYAAKNSIELVRIRGVSDIIGHVAPDDEILLIADGLYTEPQLAHSIWSGEEPVIATISAGSDTRPADFERMDINHFWAGLAKLRGQDLLSLASLPGDWSMESAALRSGVQQDYKRTMVDEEAIEAEKIAIQSSTHRMGAIEKRAVFAPNKAFTRFSERFLAAPLTQKLAPYFWRSSRSKNILRGLEVLFSLAAPAAAYFSNTVIGIILLFSAIFAGYIRQNLFGFFEPLKAPKYIKNLYWISVAAIIAIGLYKSGDSLSYEVIAYLTLSCAGLYWYFMHRSAGFGKMLDILRDPLVLALALGAAAVFGHLTLAVIITGLIFLTAVMFGGTDRDA